MSKIPFEKFLNDSSYILGEGAVIERLRRTIGMELDPFLVNAAFIYGNENRVQLERICRQYLDIGYRFNLPLVMSAATWRASRD